MVVRFCCKKSVSDSTAVWLYALVFKLSFTFWAKVNASQLLLTPSLLHDVKKVNSAWRWSSYLRTIVDGHQVYVCTSQQTCLIVFSLVSFGACIPKATSLWEEDHTKLDDYDQEREVDCAPDRGLRSREPAIRMMTGRSSKACSQPPWGAFVVGDRCGGELDSWRRDSTGPTELLTGPMG